MPWVGLCDLSSGLGYSIIVDTSDDAYVDARQLKLDGRELVAPQVVWERVAGEWAYPRRMLYHFTARGGYVDLAKHYRAYARRAGVGGSLYRKAQEEPQHPAAFRAPDVWGDASLKFAQAARAAGVEKMLIHGRPQPEEMKAINQLGYLTSEYDNYTDIKPQRPGKPMDSQHDLIPEHVVLTADGQRMTAWLTFDKKTQYMKRCPAFWVPAARASARAARQSIRSSAGSST